MIFLTYNYPNLLQINSISLLCILVKAHEIFSSSLVGANGFDDVGEPSLGEQFPLAVPHVALSVLVLHDVVAPKANPSLAGQQHLVEFSVGIPHHIVAAILREDVVVDVVEPHAGEQCTRRGVSDVQLFAITGGDDFIRPSQYVLHS